MSKHRFHFHHYSSTAGIFALIALFFGFIIAPSIFWIVIWVGAGCWITALLFEIEYNISNALLLMSIAFLTVGTILVTGENPILPIGANYPTWVVMLLSFPLVSIMKYYKQSAIFIGGSIAGVSVAACGSFELLLVSTIGIVLGLSIPLIAGIAWNSEWNKQVILSIALLIILIGTPVLAWLFLGVSAISLSFTGLVGSALCLYGLLQEEPLPRRKPGW